MLSGFLHKFFFKNGAPFFLRTDQNESTLFVYNTYRTLHAIWREKTRNCWKAAINVGLSNNEFLLTTRNLQFLYSADCINEKHVTRLLNFSQHFFPKIQVDRGISLLFQILAFFKASRVDSGIGRSRIPLLFFQEVEKDLQGYKLKAASTKRCLSVVLYLVFFSYVLKLLATIILVSANVLAIAFIERSCCTSRVKPVILLGKYYS